MHLIFTRTVGIVHKTNSVALFSFLDQCMPPLVLKEREEPIRKEIYVKWRCCGGRRWEKENYGRSRLDAMMREGLLMTFEWRAEGCEGLSPEISRFWASERITYKNIKAVKWERP